MTSKQIPTLTYLLTINVKDLNKSITDEKLNNIWNSIVIEPYHKNNIVDSFTSDKSSISIKEKSIINIICNEFAILTRKFDPKHEILAYNFLQEIKKENK